MANTSFNPTWKTYENKLHSNDPQEAVKAADAFQATRDLELKTSEKARRWEKSRKEEWIKNKPTWAKERINKEKAEEARIIRELQEGGYLMGGLRPAAGLLLVRKTDSKGESSGGILIPDSVDYESNLAVVVRAGESAFTPYGEIKAPAQESETVLFRKGAGLNVKINGEPHLIIRFDEVFGVVEA